ncbi:hypothetical protein G7Y89_g14333 [Cudoniella acicularis]|uniref:C2H2-type domain-containing protein n=1 Tax=Cudoniella acicularis TaxID=354080 RepID=A0A8H4VU63_9HELO|nr:hypothetical protein G7Y89_g14333 [Cudoniella acicularis]
MVRLRSGKLLPELNKGVESPNINQPSTASPNKTPANMPAKAPKGPPCCQKCNITFSVKKELRRHRESVHQPPIQCPSCELTFVGKTAHRKHKWEAHPPSVRCPECDLLFVKSTYRQHRMDAHPSSTHCVECALSFPGMNEYLEHRREAHPSPYHCVECALTFPGMNEQLEHKRQAHQPIYRCSKCNITFPDKKARRKHKRKLHPPVPRCFKCNLIFPDKKASREHKRKVHPPVLRCFNCDLKFSDKVVRREHKRQMHPQCKYCMVRLVGQEGLKSHQQITGHVYCLECDIPFQTMKEHTFHVRNLQHVVQYHCCDCDREYPSQEALDYHCCDCDGTYRSQELLSKHFKSTSHILNAALPKPLDNNPLPHTCGNCNEGFRTAKRLKKHMLSKHKPPRNIPCPVGGKCIKKFATPSALLNHLESGSCRSGMTRAKMTELVFAHDQNRYITSIDAASSPIQESTKYDKNLNFDKIANFSSVQIPNFTNPITRALENLVIDESSPPPAIVDDDDTASEWSVVGGVLLTPTTSEGSGDWSLVHGVPLTPDADGTFSQWSFMSGPLIATPGPPSNISGSNINFSTAIAGLVPPNDLRCPLCPPTREAFKSVTAFKSHVSSAAHAPKIFHCPLSLMPNVKLEDLLKRRSFKTLGGLTQHLEMGGCEGGIELYKKAMKFVEEQLECLGISGVRLLIE